MNVVLCLGGSVNCYSHGIFDLGETRYKRAAHNAVEHLVL